MKFSTRTREIIKNRAKGTCEVCGTSLRIYAQIHHRRPRGMGGSRSLETGGAANGLYVHQKCHERIESRRASAQNSGLLLHQTQIPSEVPVKLWYGWHVLKDDGSVVACQRLGEGGEASLTVGVNNFGNVEVTTYGDYVERIPDPVSSGVSTDHSDDRSLADTQLGSDNVGGDSVGFGLVAD